MNQLVDMFSALGVLDEKLPEGFIPNGFSSDSRRLSPGNLYFAIRGHQVDGHKFVNDLPARCVSVVEDKLSFHKLRYGVLVKNTRRAMALFAAHWYDNPSRQFQLLGVTGTNGKTTSSFLAHEIWTQLGKKAGLMGTIDYRAGDKILASGLTTPDSGTLQKHFGLMLDEGIDCCAIEVSSIALDQDRVTGSDFDVVLFTNLSQDHLDYHTSMEEYFNAKRKLFIELNPRAAVINLDDPYGQRLWSDLKQTRVGFSLVRPTDFFVRKFELTPTGTIALLECPEGSIDLKLSLMGKHNLQNVVGVLASLFILGVSVKEAAQVLEHSQGAPGRLERVGGGGKKIFVDYAHTPDALENVLRALKELPGTGRLITVFGCGGDRDCEKRPLMGKIVSRLSDVAIATSDNPRTESPEKILDDVEAGVDPKSTTYLREVDRRKAIGLAVQMMGSEDVLLVAGKGHEDYQILGTEKIDFDDRKVIRDYLK